MNTRLIRLAAIVVALLGLVACRDSFSPVEITEVPLGDDVPTNPATSFAGIAAAAYDLVHQELPKAELTFVAYRGECSGLSGLDGTWRLTYTERRRGFPRDRLLVGEVVVGGGYLSLTTQDYSWGYPPTIPLDLETQVGVGQIAAIADTEIRRRVDGDCTVRLHRAPQGWQVQCASPDASGGEASICNFRVDPLTGDIDGG